MNITINCAFKSQPFDILKLNQSISFNENFYSCLTLDFCAISLKHRIYKCSIKISKFNILICGVKNLSEAREIILTINPDCIEYIDNIIITSVTMNFDIKKDINIGMANKIFGFTLYRSNLFGKFFIGNMRVIISKYRKITITYENNKYNLEKIIYKMKTIYNSVVYKLFFDELKLETIKYFTQCKIDTFKNILLCLKYSSICKFIPKTLWTNFIFPELAKENL